MYLCQFIDLVFEERPVIERFFFLETVARMPYFSYVSMLHLYETLGFWRRAQYLPISPFISPYLPISPYISLHLYETFGFWRRI